MQSMIYFLIVQTQFFICLIAIPLKTEMNLNNLINVVKFGSIIDLVRAFPLVELV